MADNKKLDELLEKARRMQEQTGGAQTGGKIEGAGDVISETVKDLKAVKASVEATQQTIKEASRAWTVVRESALGFYHNIYKPVAEFLSPYLGWIGRGYKKLWNKVCYKEDPETGEFKLDRKRAGAMLLATMTAVTALTPTTMGGWVRDGIGEVAEPVVDSVRMATTYESKETLYLSDSKETFPAQDIHSVKGCKSVECGEEDGVYFYVKPSILHNAWNWAVKGNPMYIPDHVVAPIAPGVNKCEVTSYGVRWRVARWLQAYPVLLEAKCTPMFEAVAKPAKVPGEVVQQATPVAPATVPALGIGIN